MRNESMTLTIGIATAVALLFVLAPAQVAHAQLSIDPPLGCIQNSSGICNTGGCGSCTGPTCAFSTGTGTFVVSTSIVNDLQCQSASISCTKTGCGSPAILEATGKITVTNTSGSGDFEEQFIVCQAIVDCDYDTSDCGKCDVAALDNTNPTHTLNQFSCGDVDDGSGEWQYVIWATLLDTSACPDKCEQMDENACDPTDACNGCTSSSFGLAGSCCITL